MANQALSVRVHPLVKFIQVPKGADVADRKIEEGVRAKDIVITADIPLADLIVKKGALAMNPRGKVYTKETIKEALSIRNFMAQVRESGIVTGGPKPFSNKDKHHFAAALDQILTDRLN